MKRFSFNAVTSLFSLAAGALSVLPASAAGASKHPTIRAMAGAAATGALQAATTAVLVIDFQNEYFDGGRMPIPDGLAALKQTRRIVDFADQQGLRVIHVRHVLPAQAPLFAEGSVQADFHADMRPRAGELVVSKDNVSVFTGASRAKLDAALKAAGIQTLIVTGLQTHACVAGAARDAAPMGYAVIVSSDATATRDLDMPDGSRVPHRQLHAAALAGVEDTFGEVMSTAQILALPVH